MKKTANRLLSLILALTLELALVPDWFRKDFLREILDGRGVLVESANIPDQVYFALLFEFDGDAHKIRHCMYKCSVSRPSIASQTRETANTPVTETLNLTCDPLEDGIVKTKTTNDTTSATYPNLPQQAFVEYGNAIGATLKIIDALSTPNSPLSTLNSQLSTIKVSLGIMLGKAVKLAEGYLDTHSKNQAPEVCLYK